MTLVAVTALAVISTLAACGGGSDDAGSSSAVAGSSSADTESSSKTIQAFVFAPPGFNDPTKSAAAGFEAAQKEFPDITIEQHSSDKLDLDPASYLNLINSSIVSKPDGIVVFPNVGAAMAKGLDEIANQGIKVLLIDQPIPDMKNQTGFVGTDAFAAGQDAAKWLIDQFQQGQLPSAEVGVLRSSPGIIHTDARLAGFKAGIEGSPLKLVSVLGPSGVGGWDIARARTAMTDMLTAHPNLGGVFTVQDATAQGAAAAIVASNRSDIKLISIDGDTPAVEMILNNQGISATLGQDFYQEAKQAIELMTKALNGEEIPQNTYVETTLITRDNAADWLEKLEQEQGSLR